MSREQLWNSAELAEKRVNSTVAREYEVALPAELATKERKALALKFARHLVEEYGVVADVAIHAPGKGGDGRNHHAHILTTTRQVSPDGFGNKTRSLDDKKTGEIVKVREIWAVMVNDVLEKHGHRARVDHRTLKEQGSELKPTRHLGPSITAMERRGTRTRFGDRNRAVQATNTEKQKANVAEGVKKARAAARQWRENKERAEKAVKIQREKEVKRELEEKRAQEEAERQRERAEASKQKELEEQRKVWRERDLEDDFER